METENEIREIEETNSNPRQQSTQKNLKSVTKKVPEVDIRLYRRGKGPIEVFKSSLGGWDQDQLEVREILDKYGFKSIYAFNPSSGRGAPIRFARNGRSLRGYRDGSVIHVDGEPSPSSSEWRKILMKLEKLLVHYCQRLWNLTERALKKNFKDTMGANLNLRKIIHQEYREVVWRRVFTVTGTRADEEVMDTLAEIQEPHDAVRDLERKLLELQQVFLDMPVLVDAQGETFDFLEEVDW